MRKLVSAGLALVLISGTALAGEFGDQLPQALYDGTVAQLTEEAGNACLAGDGEACFAIGIDAIISAYEELAQDLYRHGAVVPDASTFGVMMGLGVDSEPSGNPNPEPLTYEMLREMLDMFTARLDNAATYMRLAGEGTDFVIRVEPLKVRMDLNGDGERGADETLGNLLQSAGAYFELPDIDDVPAKVKSKGKAAAPEVIVGIDNADAYWFAGYSNITALPFDFLLAHDFTDFYNTFLHRVFPNAGLPMGAHARGGTLFMDAESDSYFADLLAGIHTASFPVIDQQRLAGVLERGSEITSLSRLHWETVLAETDDDHELVPSPSQTSIVPGREVTEEIVEAWHAALDQFDKIIAGELLIPHWRFSQGINLKTYFETATKTDILLLFTGHEAVPYLSEGPIASAESFREMNEVMGDDWPFFAIWFN